jgi:hypothetical protein
MVLAWKLELDWLVQTAKPTIYLKSAQFVVPTQKKAENEPGFEPKPYGLSLYSLSTKMTENKPFFQPKPCKLPLDRLPSLIYQTIYLINTSPAPFKGIDVDTPESI